MPALLLLLCSGLLSAQTYFNRIHLPGNNNANVIASDTGYVVLKQGNPPIDHLELHYFDLSGNYLSKKGFAMGAFFEDCRNCLEPYNSGHLYGGILFYAPDSFEVALVVLDQYLDTLQTSIYSYQNKIGSYLSGVKVFSPNEIVITGINFIKPSGAYRLFVARLDSNFNVVWENEYGRLPAIRPGGLWGYDIEKAGDEGYLIGGIETNSTDDVPKGLLLKTDSTGTEEWLKSLTGPEGNNEVLLQKIDDTTFSFLTIQQLREATSNLYWNRLRKGIIDQSGNILQDTLIGPEVGEMTMAFYELTADGNYITGGYALTPNWGSHAMKFSESGDSIWYRDYFYGKEYVVDEGHIESMAHTSDSGFVFCGFFADRGPGGLGYHTWLIKTDKYGCDTAGCHNISLPELPMGQRGFSVYPNPNPGKFTIEITEGEGMRAKLYDLKGVKLWEQEIKKGKSLLDVSQKLAPGVYLLQITDRRGKQVSRKLVVE